MCVGSIAGFIDGYGAMMALVPEDRVCMDDQDNNKQKTLEQLKVEHRDLDDVIARLAEDAAVNQIRIQRLKKRKLALKDLIIKIESGAIPNIIA